MALTKLSLLVAAATALAPAPTLRTVSRRSFGGLVVAAPGVASAAGTKLENGQALPDGALQSAAAPRAHARAAQHGARAGSIASARCRPSGTASAAASSAPPAPASARVESARENRPPRERARARPPRGAVRRRKENIDDKEWDGVPQFLRKLYDAGDDMLFMSKAMDASKKEQAKVLATDFKAQVKAVDRPAQAKDRDAVVKTYKSTSGIMQSFLDLASDVPDEL